MIRLPPGSPRPAPLFPTASLCRSDVSPRLARSQAGDKGALAPVEMYVGPVQHPQPITQEFGTFKDAAQPFMRPAWDAQRVHALDIIGTALEIELDKAAKRYAKKVAAGTASWINPYATA